MNNMEYANYKVINTNNGKAIAFAVTEDKAQELVTNFTRQGISTCYQYAPKCRELF